MRQILFPCLLLTGLSGLILSPTGRAVEPAKGDSDTQKIVYLADRGPLLIELRLRIDGESFRTRHKKLIDALFTYLDRDGDGVLSKAEAAVAPPTPLLLSPLALLIGRGFGNPGRTALDGDGKMTREQLAAHYRKTGLPACQISDPSRQLLPIRFAPQNNEATAEQLTDRLFQLLDTDKDGQLSRKELEAAPTVLAALDIDEDEMITTAELMGEAAGSDRYGPALALLRRARPPTGVQPLYVAADEGEDPVLAKALLARYGKSGGESVPAAAFGLSKEALAVLDSDRDGKLSLAELARFSDKPADVAVTVNLGNRSGKPVMALSEGKPLPAGVQVKATAAGVTLQLGLTRLDLHATAPPSQAMRIDLRAQFATRFRNADQDGKGYLERMTARGIGPIGAFFDAMDRDGDGKVTEKEFLAYFDQLETFRKLVDKSCLSLAVANQGKGLFGLLDADGDGRLSVRELRNAHKVLTRLDAGDKLSRAGVPHHYSTGIALGPNGGVNPLSRVALPQRRDMGGRRAEPARGPMWFQKMDRNRDGDVSRKEFIGTDEQFSAIDADGDGLISVEEAERYDKAKRPASERKTEERRDERKPNPRRTRREPS